MVPKLVSDSQGVLELVSDCVLSIDLLVSVLLPGVAVAKVALISTESHPLIGLVPVLFLSGLLSRPMHPW